MAGWFSLKGITEQFRQTPSAGADFGRLEKDILTPGIGLPGAGEKAGFGRGIGLRNLGTRSVKRMNESLSGKGVFGGVMQAVLAFGLIAAVASFIGNRLDLRNLKNKRQEVEKRTLAAQNIEKAAKLHEFSDYVEQYGLPEEMRRTDNVARYAPEGQKAFTEMALKSHINHSLN